jgi:hypothetical protein
MRLAGLICAAVAASAAGAADRSVSLAAPAPIAKGLDAIPRIQRPNDDAERRVNAAAQRLDDSVRKAAADCHQQARQQASEEGDWSRDVKVTMAGPGYVSYLIADDLDCGGAYPNESLAAVVFDLRTGAPADWNKLLPRWSVIPTSDTAADGARVVTVTSARLSALYLKLYGHRGEDAEECREVITDPANGQLSFFVWPDAGAHGLVADIAGLPHAVQACAHPITLPLALLKAEGADVGFLSALERARP